ncbi:MAG: SusC/RagA family TonB-linked outer membrane protein [Flavobacteriia bacterium]|nr:MAG: SusC/RagA family TonB-linked outer membrane protein [Flavobacteriia bacterium]
MNKFKIFIAGMLFILPAMLFAQMKVSGVVTETATGEPLPGVNIQIVGTDKGTTTDFDGNYVLDNVSQGDVLEFTYVGFKTFQAKVTSAVLNVGMEEDAQALEEVVVIGYGTAKKEDLTGVAEMVSAKDFEQGAIVSTQNLITGKIAGVSVTSGSGAPGDGSSIKIRGLSSLSLTNDPLYVIDGVPLDNSGVGGSRNILDIINPNDIENLVVLKDASATAIYGSRAANGVVMITTKKGKDRAFSFNLNTKGSFYHVIEQIDMMDASTFRNVVQEIGSEEAIERLGDANTNWQKEIFNNASGFDTDFSALGSFKGIPIRLSVGYNNQDGILETDTFERTTASLNVSPAFMDDHLKFEVNARGTTIDNRFADRGAIGSAARFDPTQPVYDDNGDFFTWIDPNTNAQYNLAPTNPVALLQLKNDISDVKRFIGNVKMDYKFHYLPDLTATINVGLDKSHSDGSKTVSENMPSSETNWNGSFNKYTNKRTNKLFDSYLTYTKDLNKNNIVFTGGYSYQSFDIDNYDYDSEKEEVGNDPETYDLQKSVLLSYFGRLKYGFDNRFLLTATLRADASSKLNPNDRWGFFPSAALAWNIHNENFMKDTKFNELKLRIGYGEVGNVNGLESYKFLTRYNGSTSSANYQFGNNFYQTYRPEPINKNIRWEVGRTLNLGLDWAVFDRRLSGAVNLYKKETKDLIIFALVDPFTNFGNRVEKNIGDMVNKGIEFDFTGIPVQNDDFKWTITYNMAYNDNEISRMPFDQPVGGIEGGVGNNIQSHTVGHSPFSFLVYEQVYDNEGRPIEGVYVDRNNDGVINNDDKYFYKDPIADVQMGLSTQFKYKNLDLSVSARSNIGNYMYDNVASSKAIPSNINSLDFLTNLHNDYFETGFQSFSETNLLSDHYITDASFVKIDNITVGISFPDFYKEADARIFGTIQNVATFTKYKGLDPEIYYLDNNDVKAGIDNNFYPRPRVFTIGLNFDF